MDNTSELIEFDRNQSLVASEQMFSEQLPRRAGTSSLIEEF
jgi:hypothetical protein